MAVSVKDYLNSIKSVSSSQTTSGSAKQSDLKVQQLLSQLLEALALSSSVKFNKKELKSAASGSGGAYTNKQVVDLLKSQEKLINQLAQGQKLSNTQSKELTNALDRFYDASKAKDVNYKNFAMVLERYAKNGNLPGAVQNRLINDSRNAHINGTAAGQKVDTSMIPIVKKIKYLLEDSAEATKQFTKKLFVTLDQFREDLVDGFKDLVKQLQDGDLLGNLMKTVGGMLSGLGMLWMTLSEPFKRGDFKLGIGLKQLDNISTMIKAFKKLGSVGKVFESIKDTFKGIKSIFKTVSRLPKFMSKLGLGKGFGAAGKQVGKKLMKGLGKKALKKIPGIGTLLSLWMMWERWQKKDYTGAFIELGSGIAAIFPGVGTAISVMLDLINLQRDTGLVSKLAGSAVGKVNKKIGIEKLMKIPVIGLFASFGKAMELALKGHTKEAIDIIGEGFANTLPGGDKIWGLLTSAYDFIAPLLHLPTSGKSKKPKKSKKLDINTGGGGSSWGDDKNESKKKPSKAKPIIVIGQSTLADKPKKTGQSTWRDKPKEHGAGDNASAIQQLGAGGGSSFGQNLANAAISVGGHNFKSKGICALKVGDALAKVIGNKEANTYRGNAWQWIAKLKNQGKKYFNTAGYATSNKDLANLPPGTIAVWNKQSAHPYGHIEIADGKGHLISDFSRPANLGLYRNNPAGIRPLLFTPKGIPMPSLSLSNPAGQEETSSASDVSDGTTEEPQLQTFSDVMAAFNAFNQQLDSAAGSTGGSPAVSSSVAGSSYINATMPTSPSGSFKPAPPQIAQTVTAPSQPDNITTEIKDTDIALLNSLLFQ